MRNDLQNILEKTFDFSLNKNQFRDIERLMFEIGRRQNTSQNELIDSLKKQVRINKISARDKFFLLKKKLIELRFPMLSEHETIDSRRIFLNSLRTPIANKWPVSNSFTPLEIFVEKEVKNSILLRNFRKKFPNTPIKEVNSYGDYLKENKFNLAELKKPSVFIVKENWDFLKPCPCTKSHLRCGYWIFNLGFGCPFDCTYCFLQQYSNFPGLILPANLEDFFNRFDTFAKKIKHPIRIGTGEFCDSLALDDITEYSKNLIPYFKNKNVFFELKTKSSQIKNLLPIVPTKNIIISWSLNPQELVESEENGSASLKERLESARILQEKGYRLGFHFDPIIHLPGWETIYKDTVDLLYKNLNGPFAWISLGTLRCNRKLKTISEIRNPKTNIFYGELLTGEDKKLRYPEFIRKKIYREMLSWIQYYDQKTPVYLCMEGKEIWKVLGKDFTRTEKIESYITGLSKKKINR